MDKEILAVVGKLYLENMGLTNLVEALRNRGNELENLVNNPAAPETTNSSTKSRN